MSYHVTQSAYPGRRASHLPCRYDDIPGMQLQLDYLLLGDVTEAFRLIQESAVRGANVGIDEYPDEESFRDLIKWCDVFSLKCGNTGRLQALIATKPSFLSRTVPIYSARIYVFCSAELESVDAFGCLLSLTQHLARETGTYYTGCMMLIFRKCDVMLLELRRQKFLIVARLPLDGTLVDVGKCETLVLYKDFDGVEPIELPLNERRKFLTDVVGSAPTNAMSFPVLTSLPANHVFRSGLRATLRMMRPADGEAVYGMFVHAARAGRGYGEDDVLSFEIFRQFFLLDHYNIVWEFTGTRTMFAFTAVGATVYARVPTSTACDVTIVLEPEYYGRGMGVELQEVSEELAKDLGYSGVLSDTPVVNHRVGDIISSHGYNVVGHIPNSIRMAGCGVVDLLFSYKKFDNVTSFKTKNAALRRTSKL